MNEPIWAKILITMYKADPPEHSDTGEQQYDWNNNDIIEASDLNEKEVDDGLIILKKWDLIHKTRSEGEITFYEPTAKGLEVAHDRDLNKRRQKTTAAVAIFTLTLVLAQVIDTIPAEPYLGLATNELISVKFILIFALLFFINYVIYTLKPFKF